jgi:hypothetical protein
MVQKKLSPIDDGMQNVDAEQHLSLSRDSYDKIIKNTGLPDALKLRTLEHHKNSLKKSSSAKFA